MQHLLRKNMIQKRLKKSIWGGLGLPLGRVWDSLGRLLDALGRFLWGRIWLGPRFADFWTSVSWKSPLNYFGSETPALPRQLAWRHNARGSLRQLRVLDAGVLKLTGSLLLLLTTRGV